jgi:outer membrane autotransporter protein
LASQGYNVAVLSDGILANLLDWQAGSPGTSYFTSDAAGTATQELFNFTVGGTPSSAAAATGILNALNGNLVGNFGAVNANTALSAINIVTDIGLNNIQTYGLIQEKIGSGSALASAVLNQKYLNRFWVRGFGLWEDADASGGRPGYDINTYGLITGIDHAFGPVIAGASFGYAKGNYKDAAAQWHGSDIDSYAFNLYGTYVHCSGLFASILGGYTFSDNDVSETYQVGNAWAGNWREDFNSHTWYVSGKLGVNYRPAANFTLTPSAGIGYLYTRASSHGGYLGGTKILDIGKADQGSGILPIDLAASYRADLGGDSSLGLNAKAGYVYSFKDDAIEGTALLTGVAANARPLQTRGRKTGHHALRLGAGIDYRAGCFDIGVNYEYYAKKQYDAHRLQATVGVSF